NAASFDLVSACSGFIFGLATAYQYIATGMYETVLVVGADILSKYTNYDDKSTCILFGDGAGAAIIKRSDENSFLDFKLKTDSNINDLIHIPSTGTEISHLPPFLTMKGKEVFKWAVNTVPDMIYDSISKLNLTINDIDYFLLHQANNRITESIRKKLDINKSKFPSNIETHGNTSAASVPILLSQSIDSELIKKGNKILLAGFGAGISYATCILEWKI
ncbi:MAG: beta-ketoacyl-ACP synthase 3, partial [Candidatus Sericytochromatia bacterium]